MMESNQYCGRPLRALGAAASARESRTRAAGTVLALVALATTGCIFVARPAHETIPSPPAGFQASDVAFASASGSSIHAWFAPGRPGVGAVLLLHGIGENRAIMGARAKFLHDAGYTVLAPDFAGHGESSGERVTYGAAESLDAAAAMAYLHAAAPRERIGVIGVSMGGAAALLGSRPLHADALVLESVYPTIRNAVSNRLAAWSGPLSGIARRFTSIVVRSIAAKTGVNERELQPISRIGELRAPLLLITGASDVYTPLAEAESLFARAPTPKTMWVVDGAGHEDLHAFAPGEYEARVGQFLAAHLGQSSPQSSTRLRPPSFAR